KEVDVSGHQHDVTPSPDNGTRGQAQSGVQSSPIPGQVERVAGDEAHILHRLLEFLTPPEYRQLNRKQPVRPGGLSSAESTDKAKAIKVPRPLKGRATEVIGAPLGKPGFYIVEFASPRLGAELHGDKGKPYYVATSALVTNLAVHLKHGREGSLVWVTHLSDGSPAAHARVSVRSCRGDALFQGTTDDDGVVEIGPVLPPVHGWPPCPHVAFAQEGEDLSFTLSTWREGIEPWNYGMNVGYWQQQPVTLHTVFDRTLFRARETVSMKHVARVPVGRGFRLPKANEMPGRLTIWHTGSDQKIELPVHFDAQGIAESTWQIPKEAKLGVYQLEWQSAASTIRANAQFRVEA